MLHRQLILGVASLALFSSLHSIAEAQGTRLRENNDQERPRPAAVSGIITERLSRKDRQRWSAIERIVFAEDSSGQMRHPTLRSLWEWVEASGHAIYIEFIGPHRASTCTAGSFSIEKLDPQGKRHEAVIRLHLSNIDQAYVGPRAARADNFIPFEGLNKEERYAEVLGHELAHSAFILGDLRRAEMVEELVEQTNEMLLTQAQRAGEPIGQEMRQRIIKRDSFLKDLEAQAEMMEAAVWREIFASKKLSARHLIAGKK
jgi:hypothetical protein